MMLIFNIIALFTIGTLSALFIPLDRFLDAAPFLGTALSIQIAAVFVRLNRGMPSLEWKNVDPGSRKRLANQFVALSKEYVGIISFNGLVLFALLFLIIVGSEKLELFPRLITKFVSGIIGGFFTVCLLRMAYVVWRDLDIIKLQNQIIIDGANKEQAELEISKSESVLADIKSKAVRGSSTVLLKPWDNYN